MRKVMLQYMGLKEEQKYFEFSPDELLINSVRWFISLVENTTLEADGIIYSTLDFIAVEALSRQKNPPYGLMYPSLVWFLANLGKERLDYLFGVTFTQKLNNLIKEFKIDMRDS